MVKNFGEATVQEQVDFATQIAAKLKEADINANVDIYREEVAQLTQDEVTGRTILRVAKSLPSTDADKADKFNESIKDLKEQYEGLAIKVTSAINAGDMYKTIKNVTTIDKPGEEVSIEHKLGQVMFIDFWATWCPPCQRPMQHNQDMLAEHGEKWGDNLKIIGLSIDQDAETVKNHVNNKGWTSVEHYHRAKSDCSDVYKVNGVPHVMILDKQGKIVFKGHPANRKDLVKDFDDLIAGKPLEGVDLGGGPAEEEGESNEEGTSVTVDDLESLMRDMNKFRDVGNELQKECGEKAKGMMRNFCVLTAEASLKPTGKWSCEYTNHRVLVGPKDQVDECQKAIEAKLGTESDKQGWTFKINEQIMPQ